MPTAVLTCQNPKCKTRWSSFYAKTLDSDICPKCGAIWRIEDELRALATPVPATISPDNQYEMTAGKDGFSEYRFDSQEAFRAWMNKHRGSSPVAPKRDNTDFGAWFRR